MSDNETKHTPVQEPVNKTEEKDEGRPLTAKQGTLASGYQAFRAYLHAHMLLMQCLIFVTAVVWLPVVFVLYCVMFGLSALCWVIELSFIFCATFAGIAGFAVMAQAFWGGLFYIGAALISVGLAVLFLPVIVFSTTKAVEGCKWRTERWVKYVKKEALHD
ncbi:hypothetical protein NFX39_03925 [Fructobacillus sp. W13]|uniref:Integral membrane protein n=1 Tax=Fructobacillus apis TaxID=2935017 RepID=A0ABT0ZQI5_9LACO|nr:hypothetical protein [Fructobacillus apis]MCO0832237.1 hypothetical protein [Fructobacillus apis]